MGDSRSPPSPPKSLPKSTTQSLPSHLPVLPSPYSVDYPAPPVGLPVPTQSTTQSFPSHLPVLPSPNPVPPPYSPVGFPVLPSRPSSPSQSSPVVTESSPNHHPGSGGPRSGPSTSDMESGVRPSVSFSRPVGPHHTTPCRGSGTHGPAPHGEW